MIYWICFAILWPFLTILFPTKIVNKKRFPKRKQQNVIVACNHMSNVDAPLLAIKFSQKFTFLAKIELFKNKFLGWLFKKFDCIPVDRNKPSLSSMKKVFSAINNKRNVCIFPQGTRREFGEIDEEVVKNGVTLFALRTGTPVLPMVMLKKPKIFRRNTIIIGELLYPDMERAKDKDYFDEFAKLIITNMNQMLTAQGGKNASKNEGL